MVTSGCGRQGKRRSSDNGEQASTVMFAEHCSSGEMVD